MEKWLIDINLFRCRSGVYRSKSRSTLLLRFLSSSLYISILLLMLDGEVLLLRIIIPVRRNANVGSSRPAGRGGD
jgi:hypothetical protein